MYSYSSAVATLGFQVLTVNFEERTIYPEAPRQLTRKGMIAEGMFTKVPLRGESRWELPKLPLVQVPGLAEGCQRTSQSCVASMCKQFKNFSREHDIATKEST